MLLTRSAITSLERQIEKVRLQSYDPVRDLKVIPSHIDFGQSVLGAKFDKWQMDYMKAATRQPRVAIAASRQSGKSTITTLFGAYCLVFYPNFTIVVASRSLRQASYFMDKVRQAVLTIVPKQAMVSINRLSMELPNGSQIISVPTAQPDAGRGFTPHLVILDEAAFAPELLFRAISPSVAATHGAIHMISSPNGRQGRFFEAFEGEAAEVYWTKRVTWMDCPRMTEAQMEAERIAMGDFGFRQEFLSEFLTPEGAFFNADSILAFEDGMESQDYSDLDLQKMEAIVDRKFPIPTPTVEDLQEAYAQTLRVRNLLYVE